MYDYIRTPFEITDAYKLSHWVQYPKGTTGLYSNFTPRKSRRPISDKFAFFGLQYFLQILNEQFNTKFFSLSEDQAVQNFDDFYKDFFGASNEWSNEQVRGLHRLGYVPLLIKALPEGSMVNHNIPVLTIRSTSEEYFWFSQWIETWLSSSIWKMCTSATTAKYYRRILEKYNSLTSDIDWITDFQMHNFSLRGMSGIDDGVSCDAAHLLVSKGTDTCPTLSWVRKYYPGDNGLVGTSVAATEHAVATAYLPENTDDTNKADTDYISRVLELYPVGIVSMVADTYNFWNMIVNILPKFKDQIMARDGKLVIRPDSSPKTPVEIIVGDPDAPDGTPENKGLIMCLYEIFGGTKNSKGYIDLDPHINGIYGDSITLEFHEAILKGLMQKGFSSNNIVEGIGSYTYNYTTRDVEGIAIKCTAVAAGKGTEQHWRATYKDPATDTSGKKSAKGFLKVEMVNGEYVLVQNVSAEEELQGALEPVYLNGKILRMQSFAEVRAELAKF